MKGHGEKLTQKQELVISALLQSPNMTEAAKAAGISETTLWRWLKNDDFKLAYAAARREAVQQAVVQVQRASCEAVRTLKDVMADSEAPASSRVAAAKAVLEMSLKAVETEDLERRIVELEKAVNRKDM